MIGGSVMSRLGSPPRSIRSILLALLLAACTTAQENVNSTSTPPTGGAGPPVTAPEGLPTIADIPLYRANTTANGIDPGPGPAAKPVLAWRQNVGETHMVPILVNGLVIVGTIHGRIAAIEALT